MDYHKEITRTIQWKMFLAKLDNSKYNMKHNQMQKLQYENDTLMLINPFA